VATDLIVGGNKIEPGARETLELPLAQLYTHTPLTLPVHVWRGRKPGASLFLSAALHGDELNGVEIIRRVLRRIPFSRLSGTLLAVPIVNVYGVIQHSRYLPDRRDLNRVFPGSEKGSLAARLAHLLMREIVSKADIGIDLHTGAMHRNNWPQVRANLDDPQTLKLARAFGISILINADMLPGSLREAAARSGVRLLVYEAGEALRFDEACIRRGVAGIINIMRALRMLPAVSSRARPVREPLIARNSAWVRAPTSGVLRTVARLGTRIRKHQILGVLSDPFGASELEIRSPGNGLLIGQTRIPLVHEGEALFHFAKLQSSEAGELDETLSLEPADGPYVGPDSVSI
jgi:uncharacterized protein